MIQSQRTTVSIKTSAHCSHIQSDMQIKVAYTSLQKTTQRIKWWAYDLTRQGSDNYAQQKYTCVLEKGSNWLSEAMQDYAHKDKVLRGFEGIWHD